MFHNTKHVLCYLLGSLIIGFIFPFTDHPTSTKIIAPIIVAGIITFPIAFIMDTIAALRVHFSQMKVELLPPLPRQTLAYDREKLFLPLNSDQ